MDGSLIYTKYTQKLYTQAAQLQLDTEEQHMIDWLQKGGWGLTRDEVSDGGELKKSVCSSVCGCVRHSIAG